MASYHVVAEDNSVYKASRSNLSMLEIWMQQCGEYSEISEHCIGWVIKKSQNIKFPEFQGVI
jgi:hypothetical protein